MTANQQQILESARQGNVKAIASLLYQALETESEQIWISVSRQAASLSVHLEAVQTPDQDRYSPLIRATILSLGLSDIQSVQIYGYQMGASTPAWQQEFVVQAAVQGHFGGKIRIVQPTAFEGFFFFG